MSVAPPPEDLVSFWTSRLQQRAGESVAARRVRALATFGPNYDREQRLHALRAERLDELRRQRSAGDHSLELNLFREDLLAYGANPSRNRAMAFLWSTHNIRFTFGDCQARRIWADAVRDAGHRIPSLVAIRNRWQIPADPSGLGLYW